jgi:hypothetical protein
MSGRQLRRVKLMERAIGSVSFKLAPSRHALSVVSGNHITRRMSNDQAHALEQLRARIKDSQNRLLVKVDEQIALHAAPSCRELCDKMQRDLPRELRDMIYQYLLPEVDILIGSTDFLPESASNHSRPQLVDTPHMIAPEYSDPITRRELFEAWYKFCTFQFASDTLIPQFLHKDLWGLDLPVRQLVRKLEIDIWPIENNTSRWDHRIAQQRCRSQPGLLDSLLAIRPGAEMVFSVNTTNFNNIWRLDPERIRIFVGLLSRYFSSTARLLAAGHRVVADLDIGLEIEVSEKNLDKVALDRMLRKKHIVSQPGIIKSVRY